MAFAIHLSTESADHYVIAMEGYPSQHKILHEIQERMGEEKAYISEFQYDADYDIDFFIPDDFYTEEKWT
jgi:hypothetical protein